MNSRIALGLSAVVLTAISGFAAQNNTTVGRAVMSPTKNIIENLTQSHDLSTFLAILKVANGDGLVDTLQTPGPFTVFAPTNESFAKLPPARVNRMMNSAFWEETARTFTYYIVPGKLSTADIEKMIRDGNGKAELDTENGGILWATSSGGKILLHDEKGGMATITIKDLDQSNGVIHVINSVLTPNFPGT